MTQTPAVTPAPTAAATLPGGRLVFDRFAGSPEDAYVGTLMLTADGGDPIKLPLPVAVQGNLLPTWSPDATRLLVNVWNPPDLGRPALIDTDGTGFALIEPTGVKDDLFCSAWSPDGTELLCSIDSAHPERDGIYALAIDGSSFTRLSTSPVHHVVGTAGECGGGEGRGIYAPDGASFAFIRQYCGAGADPSSDEYGAVVIEDSDGTNQRVILDKGVRTHAGSQLSWSSDGAWIIFGTQSLKLARVHPDGTGYEVLNADLGSPNIGVLGPAWSPDGAHIVFATVVSGRLGNLYVVAADGSEPTRLPGTSGGAFPRWAPLPKQ